MNKLKRKKLLNKINKSLKNAKMETTLVKDLTVNQFMALLKPTYMNLEEASEYTHYAEQTLKNNVTQGKLKSIKRKGRMIFLTTELDRWMNTVKS